MIDLLAPLRSAKLDNLLIYVCDSLRWDCLPPAVKARGVAAKTIAASLYTASTFPSLVSGLYPPRHGVQGWRGALAPGRRGLLEWSGVAASLWCETTWPDAPTGQTALHRVLGGPPAVALTELKPPFVFLEDDKGGHCPYGHSFAEYRRQGKDDYFLSFYAEYAARPAAELAAQYRRGVEQSEARFDARLAALERSGLASRTLVIFTSDHGELLGEYGGLAGHGRPACPELVYVPTVFIHPALAAGGEVPGIIRQVDLFPTLAALFGRPAGETDGQDLLADGPGPAVGYSFYRETGGAPGRGYRARSAWDEGGGHVFQGPGRFAGRAYFLYKIFLQRHREFAYLRRRQRPAGGRLGNYLRALAALAAPYRRYGEPGLARAAAAAALAEYLGRVRESPPPPPAPAVDEATKQRLRDLGYLD